MPWNFAPASSRNFGSLMIRNARPMPKVVYRLIGLSMHEFRWFRILDATAPSANGDGR